MLAFLRVSPIASIVGVVGFVALSLACLGNHVPRPDICPTPTAAGRIDTLEIGNGQEPDIPYVDGDDAFQELGGRRDYVVWMSLRVDADGPPCLEQTTRVLNARGEVISTRDQPLRTKLIGDRRITKPIPMVLDYNVRWGREVQIETEALGREARVSVNLPGYRNNFDTGVP